MPDRGDILTDPMQSAQAAQSSARNAAPRTTPPPRPAQEGELARNLAETFNERLRRRWQEARTLLCVGLDTELERLPEAVRRAAGAAGPDGPPDDETRTERALLAFNQAMVDATADLVCAFKPNSAFYEQYGPAGMRALIGTISYIQAKYPEIPVLLDAKRGDVGSTSAAYARAVFDVCGADAVTLHPYLGRDALDPFLKRIDRGAFILCRTSNPGAGELQDMTMSAGGAEGEPLYLALARRVANEWNAHRNCGLVVGATYPAELAAIRAAVGDMPILVPGVGAQGGDLEAIVRVGLDSRRQGLLISASRSVIYASDGADFAGAARREAARLRIEIERLRGGSGESGPFRKPSA